MDTMVLIYVVAIALVVASLAVAWIVAGLGGERDAPGDDDGEPSAVRPGQPEVGRAAD
jgi:hypothetical protein